MEILVTNKGNFLVENEGIYAFFNKLGGFLRLSDLDEWMWSMSRMKKFVGDINSLKLNLKAMAEVKPISIEDLNASNKTFTLADLIKSKEQKRKKKLVF